MNTAEASAIALASRELLTQGDAEGAERLLAPVLKTLKTDAEALHLMGLIKKARNQLEEAERHFRSAVAHALGEGAYYNDLGVVLQARGNYAEAVRIYRAAIALRPEVTMVRINLVQCLLASGEIAEAEREARTCVHAEPNAETWTLLSQVHRRQEKFEESLNDALAALQCGPKFRGLRYNYANALERIGRIKEALDIYESLAKKDLDSADLAHNYARTLYAEGRKKEAEAVIEQALELWPASHPLYSTLARMRFLRGEGENSTAPLEDAWANRPSDIGLRLVIADSLHRAGLRERARDTLEHAIRMAPDTPALLSAYGIVMDELNQPEEGLKALRRVAELAPQSRSAQRNLLSTLLRAGRPDEALHIVGALRQEDQDEQYLIACEAVALRMTGDAFYPTICDYDRFVRTYEIAPPRGYFTAENFNTSLADVLRAQHRGVNPLDYQIPNGSQTNRNLLHSPDPAIKGFLNAVEGAVRDYISRLKAEPHHPFLRRTRERFRFQGLWSARVQKDGYLPNHVHDRGWISSAYYVAIMPPERPKDVRNGWLKFGEPNKAPSNCGPEKWLEPKLGQLVLFPSYMWHGTSAFEGPERLSAAFDIVPS
ncbi:tetratricopeptide repeat protein [Vitreimonas flagellata]|uniref:tetratricopeptide repeat protein n=1 Tax=Vitreimonas flagellata TaxID=2560861 RepID=UPI001074E52E|nr:tetratricopeptide repeat protein [Vitreimonas flagellata]